MRYARRKCANRRTIGGVPSNGVVYTNGAGSGGLTYAVDAVTGAVLACQSVANGDRSAPALSDTSVTSGFACNQTYSFALATLTPLWHYATYCGGGRTMAYESDRTYTRDWAGTGSLVLDFATGSLLGTYGPASVFVRVAPVALKGNRLWYVESNKLTAADVTNPAAIATRWTFAGDGQLVSAPVLLSSAAGDFVVVGSSTGMVYAVDDASSLDVWSTHEASILPTDEESISVTGAIGAGDGLLVIPAGNTLSVLH